MPREIPIDGLDAGLTALFKAADMGFDFERSQIVLPAVYRLSSPIGALTIRFMGSTVPKIERKATGHFLLTWKDKVVADFKAIPDWTGLDPVVNYVLVRRDGAFVKTNRMDVLLVGGE